MVVSTLRSGQKGLRARSGGNAGPLSGDLTAAHAEVTLSPASTLERHADRYLVIEDAFSAEECTRLVSMARSLSRSEALPHPSDGWAEERTESGCNVMLVHPPVDTAVQLLGRLEELVGPFCRRFELEG